MSPEAVLLGIGLIVYGYWLHQIAIAVHGFRPATRMPSAPPDNQFLVLIPAHNEERVIGLLLDSINAQDYPRQPTLVVACDACTDRTSAIARSKGLT